MGLFLLVILLVILIPLAEGVLFALLLREVHARHPLPLVEPGYIPSWDYSKPKAEVQEKADESDTGDATDDEADAEGPDSQYVEPTNEEEVSPYSGISVFDGSATIPKDLPVSAALNSMTTAVSPTVPSDLEDRIEESARLKDELPQEFHDIKNEMDYGDLEDLEAALPKAKIDFAQEHEIVPETSEAISSMAKELLGEDFDFDALEKQSKESLKFLAPDSNEESLTGVILDVQEDEPGTVQVSSPFLFTDSPQLADFVTPQTILSTFPNDWIQETGGSIESAEENVSSFCFTEESQPMFIRKKKAN